MVWMLSLSVLMFGLGFLAGSRWAEQKAGESEKVVIGRVVPPQVEVGPPEQDTTLGEAQEAKIWNILTGQEAPSAVLPPPLAKEMKPPPLQPKAQVQTQKTPPVPTTPSGKPQQETFPPPTASGRISQAPVMAQSPSSRFALQVVSVQSREKAEAIVRELNGKGYPLVRITQAEVPGKGTWYRIWMGSFEKKEEAESLKKQVLERERLQAQIVQDKR